MNQVDREGQSGMRSAVTLLVPLLVSVLLTACTSAEGGELRDASRSPVGSSPAEDEPAPPREQVVAAVDAPRQSGGVVAAGGGDSPYDYGPTLLLDGGRVRMWWCSQLGHAQPAGDDLLLAESATVGGPFGPAKPVFSGSVNGFDGMHTCDPSVIHVNGTHYLYYTGAAGDHAHGNAIGVATSPDGVNWTRANGGRPIVSPSYDESRENTYGAGQPSAVHVGGWFYLMFTDTTGGAAGWNGAGQFVLRSTDPLFVDRVEALGTGGFAPSATTAEPRTRSVVDAFSADWTWIDALGAFAIAHETESGTTLTFWDEDFTRNPVAPTTIPGPWQEGPGLLRTGEGHAPVSTTDPCGRLSVDVVRATTIGAAGAPTGLSHFGLDLVNLPGCATERQGAVLQGHAVPSPERTVDLVVDGELLRVERRSVADRLARGLLSRRPELVEQMPVAARLSAGAQAVRGPDGTLGLVLDDGRLWELPAATAAEIVALNGSTTQDVDAERWRDYDRRSVLTSSR